MIKKIKLHNDTKMGAYIPLSDPNISIASKVWVVKYKLAFLTTNHQNNFNLFWTNIAGIIWREN